MYQSKSNRHISSRSKRFVPAGPKCDVFLGRMWQKTSKVKKKNSCVRSSHSSQKCDKYNASHFWSPEKLTNVTSLTQIWDRNLERNWAKTDPNCHESLVSSHVPRLGHPPPAVRSTFWLLCPPGDTCYLRSLHDLSVLREWTDWRRILICETLRHFFVSQ